MSSKLSDGKNIGFRIAPREVEAILESYPNLNFGATRAVLSWPYLRRRSLNEIKGIFENNELKFIIDMRNGTVFDPVFLKQEPVTWEIMDSNEYEYLGEKWQVNVQHLIKKIHSLTSSQVFFLIDWADVFWYIPGKDKDIEKYINDLRK